MDRGQRSVVVRARAGDAEAFRQLFEAYQARIYNYLWQMVRDEELAADLTQETFIRAYRSLAELRDPGAFQSWLYRIAVNLVRDERKRAQVPTVSLEAPDEEEGSGEDPGSEFADWSSNPERELMRRELAQAVERAVAHLAPEHREVIVLHHLRGLEVRDIARILQVAEGTVKSRLGRARALLRRQLASWVED
jgi:RNA polymerase sigma-70 factor (ECF subfamily)